MPGFVKPCWIASPTERTSSKPELNRIAFDGLSRGRRKEPKHSRKTSRGNAGPWKAWKANFSLSTLPTVLEHPATSAGCSHSHRSDDSSYIRSGSKPCPKPQPWVGQIEFPKWTKCSC